LPELDGTHGHVVWVSDEAASRLPGSTEAVN
jgi:hypothetical protein